jgi:hypothetical protein
MREVVRYICEICNEEYLEKEEIKGCARCDCDICPVCGVKGYCQDCHDIVLDSENDNLKREIFDLIKNVFPEITEMNLHVIRIFLEIDDMFN